MRFSDVFDARANALNAIRLILAIGVIGWHSFPLTGRDIGFLPLRQLVGEVGVDGFFAISGFLIVASWRRDPSVWRYLAARVLRIFPAFWVCLVATAFFFAPIGTVLATSATLSEATSWANVNYVVQNFWLILREGRIADTPGGIPYLHAWNGSLWTLQWEFLCYLVVAGLGVVRLMERRIIVPLLFCAALFGVIITSYGNTGSNSLEYFARFGLMFTAGALIQRYASRLPLNWTTVGAAYVIVLASMFLHDYRVVGAVPLAYALIGTGALLKDRRLRFSQDLSYGMYIYAFPVQQVLASLGLASVGVPLFALIAVIATLPFAAASWFLIEKPVMRLRPRRPAHPSVAPRDARSSALER